LETLHAPLNLGELSILDLEKFSRALRLQWLWLDWTEESKPWASSELPSDDTDLLLFEACHHFNWRRQQGPGWQDKWIDRSAPKYIAPSLFKLIRRKNNSVAIVLSSLRWIHILRRKISMVVHVAEFVDLWSQVQQVQLLPNNLETIGWRWTRDGSDTSKSAYLSQFKGSFSPFDPNLVWKAKTKNNYKFFA